MVTTKRALNIKSVTDMLLSNPALWRQAQCGVERSRYDRV